MEQSAAGPVEILTGQLLGTGKAYVPKSPLYEVLGRHLGVGGWHVQIRHRVDREISEYQCRSIPRVLKVEPFSSFSRFVA